MSYNYYIFRNLSTICIDKMIKLFYYEMYKFSTIALGLNFDLNIYKVDIALD